jgi:hypothetical protein
MEDGKNHRWRSFVFAILYPLSTILVFSALTGCQAASVAYYKIHGPPWVEAKYVPDKTSPMLVLVENYRAPSSAYSDADLLTRYLSLELENHDVAPLVAGEKLHDVQTTRPAEFAGMSTAAIGRATGAAQVLYVQLLSNTVEPIAGGQGLRGEARVRVKVVDTETGELRWPTDLSEGYALGTSTTLGTDQTTGNAMAIRQSMYHKLADDIAKLFYKWQPEESTAAEDYMNRR